MIPPEKKEVLGILDFICEEQYDALNGLLTSVDIVPEKEIIFLRRVAAKLEDLEQVLKLPMNISDDLDGSFQLE